MTAYAIHLRRHRQKHADVARFIEKTSAEVAAREPSVNALVSWLEARKGQNGFGDDFELTLLPPKRDDV